MWYFAFYKGLGHWVILSISQTNVAQRCLVTNKCHGFLQGDVDEEIDGRVEDDEGVRDVVDDGQPFRPNHRGHLLAGVAGRVPTDLLEPFVHRRNQLPDVAEDEQPDDAQRDPCQPVFPAPLLAVLVMRV